MRKFVVYHIQSTQSEKYYENEGGAKRGRTCLNKKAGAEKYAYASIEDYNNNVVKMITVRNLMSGKEVQIPSNTPWSCRVDSESYWSA